MGIVRNIKYQISNIKYLKSFTFIEMVVVIGVIGLALPVLFAIIFAILQQQTKIYRLSQVKREGDYALNVMENIIRNYAVAIYSERSLTNTRCNTANSSYVYPTNGNLYFKDKYDNWLRFYSLTNSNTTYLASESAKVSSVNLTTNKVRVNNLTISCNRTSMYSSPIISISFQVQYNTISTRPEETASLNYQTKVKLRSY